MTDNEDKRLLSYAEQKIVKRVAKEVIVSWTGATINPGDTYYIYDISIMLYGMGINSPSPTLTEEEYFMLKLKGTLDYTTIIQMKRKQNDDKEE